MRVHRRLPRVLGVFDVWVLASAAMGPAYSLAATMGPMVAVAGAYATLALGLIAALVLCVALAFARLSRAFPDAGSSFAWIARGFGVRAGAYAAWLLLLANVFATIATALPAATYTLALVAPAQATSPLWNAVVGCAWIAASTALLARGLRPTARTTALFLIAELAVIGASAVAAALAHPVPEQLGAPPVVLPGPFAGIASAMVLGIWMTDGWEVSASAAEEARGPARTAGRGGVAGLVVTTLVLLVAMSAYGHVGSVAGFAANQTDAMAYVAARLGGGAWRLAIVATVLVSTAATLWTTLLYLSRSVYAMGRDGVLPRACATLDARSLPRNALAFVAAGVTLGTLATALWPTAASVLALVLGGTSVFLGVVFVLSALAALRLLATTPGDSAFQRIVVPAAGAVGLSVVIVIAVLHADATTRALEVGGLVLGVPFAGWRSRSMRARFTGF
ncbi:MAG: APC family permease [Vulcanimicrobiaceae bacterium]